MIRGNKDKAYNNIVLEDYKLSIHVNGKCGCTSVKRMLMNELRMEDLATNEEKCGLVYWEPKDIPIDWIHLFVVRDPWDRLESLYADKLQHHFAKAFLKFNLYQKMPFEEFIQEVCNTDDTIADAHFRSQTWTYSDELVLSSNSFIFKLEQPRSWTTITNEIYKICWFGLPKLPHLHRREHVGIVKTPELKKKVKDRFSRDYRLLGY